MCQLPSFVLKVCREHLALTLLSIEFQVSQVKLHFCDTQVGPQKNIYFKKKPGILCFFFIQLRHTNLSNLGTQFFFFQKGFAGKTQNTVCNGFLIKQNTGKGHDAGNLGSGGRSIKLFLAAAMPPRCSWQTERQKETGTPLPQLRPVTYGWCNSHLPCSCQRHRFNALRH